MPTNLFGPNDNYDLNTSHVLPALIRKFHEAKMKKSSEVTLWGTGSPKREFLYVDDLADAVVFLMEKYDYQDIGEIINIGRGVDISIRELAETIKNIVGYQGEIRWDSTKPDGTPRKLLDINKIKELGWEPSFTFEDAIKKTYENFRSLKQDE
jgi:GDP-L-fucose synthase